MGITSMLYELNENTHETKVKINMFYHQESVRVSMEDDTKAMWNH